MKTKPIPGMSLHRMGQPARDGVCIREGRSGNGHYVVFFWSFLAWTADGGREAVHGKEQTWRGALEAALNRQDAIAAATE